MPSVSRPLTRNAHESIEQALQQSEERFRCVVESALSAMIMVRASGRIELVNAQTERVFGYERAELLGQPVEMLVPERFRRHHPQSRGVFFAEPRPRLMGPGAELFGLRKDGTEVPLEIGLNPLATSDGPMVLATIVDISERKRMEERFRRVVEAAPSAIVMVRLTGEIEMVNAQIERFFGYQREELLGRPLSMLVPERFRARHAQHFRRFFNDPSPRPMGGGHALPALRKDGSEFQTEIGLNPINTEDGLMILASIVDISERIDAASALARSEARFRASFEGTAVGKVLAHPETGHILQANRAFARMLGYEPEELASRSGLDFIWSEDWALVAADRASLLSGEAEATVRELRYTRRDGAPFWARVSTAFVRPAGSGERPLLVEAIEDIDTRHRAETALREAKQQLEQVVEERTNALSQRDLLLREVYHRVKNNLQLVDSLLMMQARKLGDPQSKQELAGLRGRIFALGLVHQQLMGSADLKTFDVVPFLADLSKNIIDSGGSDGVDISVDACTLDIGLDLAVPLGLLVTELVTNSLKHAFPGGVGTITVTLRNDADGKLVLMVSDNGVGPSHDFQAGQAESGLGTRIIANLVHQLEGTMVVRTEHGMTTEIHFPMPAQS